jgi:hypothetical protein
MNKLLMKKLLSFFYTDSYLFGILLAFLVPLLSAIPVFPLLIWLKSIDWIDINMPISKYILLCCIPNFIVIRQYFKVLQMEKTGKALFLVSLAEVAVLIILSNRSAF